MLTGYRTYISIVVALLSTVSESVGLEFDVEGVDNALVTLASLSAAIYYRYKATKQERDWL